MNLKEELHIWSVEHELLWPRDAVPMSALRKKLATLPEPKTDWYQYNLQNQRQGLTCYGSPDTHPLGLLDLASGPRL